jgi:hypothetical protein
MTDLEGTLRKPALVASGCRGWLLAYPDSLFRHPPGGVRSDPAEVS